MTDEKIIKNIVEDRSIPRFVKENYPTFVAFIDAYLAYLEEVGNPADTVKNLRNYSDIDSTLDQFVEYFRKKYMINIPASAVADPKLLIKNIKNFYLNKGNEASYKFLFRILFDQDVSFFYPKTQILRCSDGKWEQKIGLKIEIESGIPTFQSLTAGSIIGQTSGALCKIQSVISTFDRGIEIYDITIINLLGNFLPEEMITIEYTVDGVLYTYETMLLEVYKGVTITDAGSGYKVNDPFYVRDSEDRIISNGIVTATTSSPVTGLTIVDGGQGYRGNRRVVSNFKDLPANATFQGIYLPDAPIQAIDSFHYNFATQPVDFPIDDQTVEDVGDIIFITDDGLGSGAYGVVDEVDENGTILSVILVEAGKGYNNPTAHVVSSSGTGAIISVQGGGGGISKVQVYINPVVLDDNEEITVDFTISGNHDGLGEIELGGAVIRYPGKFINTDGFLSWADMKLEDNYYYQDFSYVLLSAIPYERWKDLINKIIHPAGFLAFGETLIKQDFVMGDIQVVL